MSQVTPEHVAGLVVGEGCFYTESGRDKKYRSGWRIRPAFCIETRCDDREVLEEVREHLDCGRIYELDFGRYRGYESKGWKPHVKYRVSNLVDLHGKVVPFFRQHRLFGRKKRAFEIFEQLVHMMYAKEHLSPDGLEEAKELARQLTEHNKKG
jgi:LAGLIDADG endonuclease